MEERGIQARFGQWREREGLSLREVMEAVNEHLPPGRRIRTKSTISNYEKTASDKPPPRADFLAALKEAFPTLNVDWIITGRRSMYALQEGRQEYREMLREKVPAYAAFPESVQELFRDTLTRYIAGSRMPWPKGDPETFTVEVAKDVLFLVNLPAKAVRDAPFGSERVWETYLLAMLQAVRIALPRRGEGDARTDLGEDNVLRFIRGLLEDSREA